MITSGSVSSQYAIVVVARLLKRLDDACPDVGMGPSIGMLVDQAAELLKITDQASIDAASRRLYVQHMMDSINSGRYGNKLKARRMLRKELGVTDAMLDTLNER